jgi:hypothetical protein
LFDEQSRHVTAIRYPHFMKRRTFFQAALAAVALAVSTASSSVRAAVADICSKVSRRPRAIILPPVPKWNPVTDDIDSADFFRRLQDHERSLLPANLVFPRVGQIWETLCDCQVPVLRRMVSPKGPFIWPNVGLRRGERVRILALDHAKPLRVKFEPIGNPELPETTEPGNLGDEYWLRTACTVPVPGVKTVYFNELFRLVGDA